MLTKRSLLLHPIALMGYLLLGGLVVASWLWFSQVSDRVLASLTRQTGLSFVDKAISFDPWQRRLSVSDIHFKEKGVQLSSGQLSFILIYRHWWEPWLGEEAESFSAVELVDARINIDPHRMAFSLPTWFQALSIKDGRFSMVGIDQSLSFEQLTLNVAGDNKLDVHIADASVEKAEKWTFSGTYKTDSGKLAGELNLNGLSLSEVFSVVSLRGPLTHTFSNKAALVTSDRLFGDISAKLSLSWDKPSGLILQGSAEGQDGALSLPGISAAWQQWQLDDFQFNASDPAQSSATLSFSGADLKLADSSVKKAGALIIHLYRLLPFSITSLSMTDSRLEVGDGLLSWVFENIEGSLCEHATKNREYQATADLDNVGKLRLNGKSSDTNDYILSLTEAKLTGPLEHYSVIAGYNMQATRFNLKYDSQSQSGQLDITGWQYKKRQNSPSPSVSMDLLKALLTDKSGKATTLFNTKSAPQTGSLPEQVYHAIGQRFEAIGQAPFDYLAQVTGFSLEPLLRHEAGKATLTPTAYLNLQHLQQALALRPELKVVIDVGVSESRDWPELSRYELEEALLELYSAMGSDENAEASEIPVKIRGQLLEQMYLATRQQKIPEVGEQSPTQRVQQAEKWLLENWPRLPGQIEKLQQARYDYLKEEAGRVGIDVGRIALRLSSGLAVEPDSVLILR